MKNHGQVFTFDMLLALIIAMLIVSSSGMALSLAQNRTTNYISRYSLNRRTSDAADVLVKSPGKPADWEDNINSLKVPGLARVKENSKNSIPNSIEAEKIRRLARAMTESQWNPTKSKTQAIRKLFGNTDNFKIKIIENERTLWNIWPGWDVESSSGVEKSLEVSTSTRLIYTHPGDIVYKSKPVARENKPGAGEAIKEDNFVVYGGELGVYDWYALIEISSRKENRPKKVGVKVNTETDKWKNINRGGGQTKKVIPSSPGWTDIQSETNEVKIKVGGYNDNSIQWARVYIVGIPQGSNPETVKQSPQKVPATLTIKIWR